MRLPFLNKKEKSEFYLALLLKDEKASAVILEAFEGKIKILARHEESFSASIETIATEELTDVLDRTISRAEEILPPNVETHKTVFGLKKTWIDPETKKIQKDYLAKLKKVCGDLDLTPIGFMVTSEAISHLLQEDEGAPLSAILAEIGKNQINVTLLRGGKVVETISGDLQESPPATLDTLLKHFTVPVLPARIILFHADNSEKLSQKFITHQWSKSLPFLHVPQITVLPEGFDSRAVTFGAATQMGFEVLDIDKKPVQDIETTHTVPEKEEEEVESPTEEVEKEPEVEGHFAEEKHPEEEPFIPQTSQHRHPTANLETEDFGFVVDKEISDVKPHKHTEPEKPVHHTHHEPVKAVHHTIHHPAHANIVPVEEDDYEEEVAHHEKQPKKRFSLKPLTALLSLIKPPNSPKIPIRLLIPVILLLILIGGVAYLYFFQVKAQVILTVKPKIVEETTNITFSTTSPNDFSKHVIAAKALSTDVEGETAIDVTGKKEIGDKAKGTVTILSSLPKEQTVPAGTTLTSSNGLDFTTEKEVKIASSSGISDIKSAQVAVTAAEIGKESNLPSGTKFSVGSFSKSSVEAKNDNAFSGGSKKSVTVVSKEDHNKLKSELLKSLGGKAQEALSKKAEGDETVLPLYTNSGFAKPKFDKHIGDEAKSVKLNATVTFDGMAYKNSDLRAYAQSFIKNKHAQDIDFAENSLKETVKNAKEKNEKDAQASLVIQAGLLPKINTEEVLEKLRKKSLKQAEQLLSEYSQVERSKITFSPNIPFLADIFSRLPNNVSVTVQPE